MYSFKVLISIRCLPTFGDYFLVDCWKKAKKSTRPLSPQYSQYHCLENFPSLGAYSWAFGDGGKGDLREARKFKSEQQRSGRILSFVSSRATPIPPPKKNKTRTGMREKYESSGGNGSCRGKAFTWKVTAAVRRETQTMPLK